MPTIRAQTQIAASDQPRLQWLRVFASMFVLAFLVRFAFDVMWRPQNRTISYILVDALCWSGLFAGFWVWCGKSAKARYFGFYDLQISATEISAAYATTTKTIHRGRVRTIVERRPTFWNLYSRAGLLASEQSNSA